MAANLHPKIRTYTVRFPGAGVLDEGSFARTVSQHFSTDHTELVAEPLDLSTISKLAVIYDEPISDSSLVPMFLVSKLIRAHCTVALGGDGGDELFGGYQGHWDAAGASLSSPAVRSLRRLAAGALSRLPLGLPGRAKSVSQTLDIRDRGSFGPIMFDRISRKALLMGATRRDSTMGCAESARRRLWDSSRSSLQNATSVDFSTYLPDDILVKVDRASMANSLELRAPFLDMRLIEYAFGSVSDRQKVRKGKGKWALRALSSRLLPASLDVERKQGFSIPLGAWVKGEWSGFIQDVLGGCDPTIYDVRFIRKLLKQQRFGFSHGSRLFALALFELWRRHYRVSI
jgi:asparagine synthase (glutamine-hydrolysing)